MFSVTDRVTEKINLEEQRAFWLLVLEVPVCLGPIILGL